MKSGPDERISRWASLPFFVLHAGCLFVFATGSSPVAIAVCVLNYAVRMFGITAGYHRYFAHRSYKTSRTFQFVLAWLGGMAAQKGALWWAAHHRAHHAASDTAHDVHSPRIRGFWWSHAGWFLCGKYDHTDTRRLRDLVRYPELQFLNRFHFIPPLALALFILALGYCLPSSAHTSPLQMFVWGFLISTVLVYHATFLVNSLAHVFGSRRFATKDDSRNNLMIALLTFGEGWHNNHHFSPSSERHGFYWWEIDLSHWILTALSWCGLVWDLQGPPVARLHDFTRMAPFSAVTIRERMPVTSGETNTHEKQHT